MWLERTACLKLKHPCLGNWFMKDIIQQVMLPENEALRKASHFYKVFTLLEFYNDHILQPSR